MTNALGEQELLTRFQNLAIDHHRGSESGDSDLANSCVDGINAIVRELWRENGSNKQALKGLVHLTKSRNPAVALMAVVYVLELYPEVAQELTRLQKEKSIIGLSAKYTLANWKTGELRVLKGLLGL